MSDSVLTLQFHLPGDTSQMEIPESSAVNPLSDTRKAKLLTKNAERKDECNSYIEPYCGIQLHY